MEIDELQEEIDTLERQEENLSSDLFDLEREEYELDYSVHREKRLSANIEQTFQLLQEILKQINDLLPDHETRLRNIKERKKHMNKELRKYERAIEKKTKKLDEINEYNLCQKSLSANSDNSYYVKLKSTTATTPIFTEFCANDYEFLILDASMPILNYFTYSYIIIKGGYTITEWEDDIPPVSELKSVQGQRLSSINFPRMQSLKTQIEQAMNEQEEIKDGLIVPLKKSCPIGAQTQSNQQGYGYAEYFEQGTLYGEMTGFYVIGIIINQSPYYY